MVYNMRYYLFILFVIFSNAVFGQDTITYNDPSKIIKIGNKIEILEDKTNQLTLQQVLNSKDFKKSTQVVPSLAISNSSFWLKMTIANKTENNNLALELEYPTTDSVTFVSLQPSGGYSEIVTGEFVPVYLRQHRHQNYIFDLNIPSNEVRTYLMRVNASEQLQLPLTVSTIKNISEDLSTKDLIFGLYAGIIIVMLLYNMFLIFTVRDRSYVYYVGYILFVGMTQACLEGYAPRFLYPYSSFLPNAMMVWIPALSGVFSVLFVNNFMNIKHYTPVLHKVLNGILVVYCLIIILSFTGNYRLCTGLMQLLVMILAVVGYTVAVKISRRGYRPAQFFLIAFSIFIAGVIVFVLRNANVLPYNNYTYYAMDIGSVIEVVLLSIALADKINIFRKEKEESQAATLQALQENERIVREQNVILEAKVEERTHALHESNLDLNKAMVDLKDAQSQLVESEKMASLGQLTAGIAHEINNPINFVTSNVKPLNRDVLILIDAVDAMEKMVLDNTSLSEKQQKIEDYKTEIDYDYLKMEIDQLLNGIGEGASRTAEIVKGLRIFSRLDEDDLKKADINEGLDSTLVITNNLLGSLIKVEKHYANMPLVECYPGKLNQVFLNIISNAAYAIKKKFGENAGGILNIATTYDDNNIFVNLTDNGTGMDENTKKRLFEPFFTTKDVGEGTGLGMSIAYNTINKHNGQIIVNSEVGVGTEFIIKLPLIQKIN
jgi:signal transduction histidine kinase